ncbi:MAG: sugar ABC transporter permease [Spirochaetales bacterium]|nr:sugar ABC transporter permease [Spirochaetales bacterium]
MGGLGPVKLAPRKRDFGIVFQSQVVLMAMSIPFLLHLLLFRMGPMYGWLMAFQNFRPGTPILKQTWVGLEHFRYLFRDIIFLQVLRNTLAMAIIKLVMGTFFSVLVAIMVNETKNRLFKRSVQTISYLPHFISWVVAAHLVRESLMPYGIINNILTGLNIVKEPIFFLGKAEYFWWVIGWSHVWKTAGFGAIIYLAAMTSIDPQLYEAADIDGASRLQRIWHITLPGIRSVFVILLIMNIGFLMEAGFEQQYLLKNALVQDYADVFTIYVLEWGLRRTRFSFATAAGIFRSVVSITLIVIANFIAKRMGEETLM